MPRSLRVCWLCSCCIVASVCSQLSASAPFYVAPDGDDKTGRGTADAPFATLPRALDAARATTRPATIRLRGGTYFLDEPVILTAADSNRVIDAEKNQTPILSGGRKITGWRKARFHGQDCWAADLSEVKEGKWFFRELWIDGKRAIRSRRPDKGYFNIVDSPDAGSNWEEGQHRFRFKDDDVPPGPYPYGADAIVMMRWVESRLPLKDADSKERLASFTRKTQWILQPNDAYWLEGDPRWMDQPGEWFLDRAGGTLYYLPLAGQEMAKIEAIAPRLSQLLILRGPAGEEKKFIENVQLRGITFSHTEWMLPDPATTQPASGGFAQAATPVPAVITGDGVRNCRIDNCVVEHAGTYGIHLGRGSQRNQIADCVVRDMGAGGIRIGEEAIRAAQPELSWGNRITDCEVSDCGNVFPSAVGIWVGQSFDNVIAHNDVHDIYYSGISVGWSWGYGDSLNRGNVIEFNRVHHVGRRQRGDGPILSDMGGVYLLGARNGTIVRNNVFHDVAAIKYGGWGIYLDEGSSNVIIENNLVYNTTHGGFHLHYGRENVIRNNIFALGGGEQQIVRTREEEHQSFTFENNIVYFTDGPMTRTGPKNVKFNNNLYGAQKPEDFLAGALKWQQWRDAGQDHDSIIADPQFADPGKGNFSFPPSSPAAKILRPFDANAAGRRR